MNFLEFANCEQLESRLMLTGTMTVSQSNAGDFTIKGDGQDNVVVVASTEEGDLIVTGVLGTNIRFEGVTAGSHIIPLDEPFHLPRNLRIRSGGGDDIVAIEGIDVGGRIDASLAGGDDAIAVTNTVVSASVAIKGGGGADRIDLFAVNIGGDASLFLNSQSGTEFEIDGISVLSSVVSGDLKVTGSSRDDSIIVESTQVQGDLQLKTSNQNDVVIFYGNTISGESLVDVGSGDDTIDLEQSTFLQSSLFKLGKDSDLVNFFPNVTFAADVTIAGSSGLDGLFGIPPTFIGSATAFYESIEVNPF